MKKRWASLLLVASALWQSCSLQAQTTDFSFGVIGPVLKEPNNDAPLVQAITDSDTENLAFVTVEGFKRTDETCSDQLYQRRLDLLGNAKNGLVLSPAASDWAECLDANGRSAAVERLSRLRELFFNDDMSLGASKIPLMRQSNAQKFHSYAENTRWEIGNILFLSINLPSNNNHYRIEAGRNGEFEDRLIANRDWLQRAFAIAVRKKMIGVVLFCDGNPFASPTYHPASKSEVQHLFDSNGKRDGFAEFRQQLTQLSEKFSGKVLVIHNRQVNHSIRPESISWRGNLGDIDMGETWLKVNVRADNPAVFSTFREELNAETRTAQ